MGVKIFEFPRIHAAYDEGNGMSTAALRMRKMGRKRLAHRVAKDLWVEICIRHFEGQFVRATVKGLARDIFTSPSQIRRSIAEIEAAALAQWQPDHGRFYLLIDAETGRQLPWPGETGTHDGGPRHASGGGTVAIPHRR